MPDTLRHAATQRNVEAGHFETYSQRRVIFRIGSSKADIASLSSNDLGI